MKTLATTIALTGLAALFAVNTATAQTYYSPQATTGYSYQPSYGNGGYGWDYGYHPSTAAESYYRGYADLVRARGEANLNHARAQVEWEQAREKRIANHQYSVDTYFNLRKQNEDRRLAAIADSRLSEEQLVTISKRMAPARIGQEDWNTTNDGFAWPTALGSAEYEAGKARLDELFRIRQMSTGGLSKADADEARKLVDSLTAELKSHVKELNPNEYAAAKRFLASVAHESKLAPTDLRFAGN